MLLFQRQPTDESELSFAERLLERVVLLVFVASLIVGGGFVAVGLLGGQWNLFWSGAIGCTVAWLSREWLCQRGRFDALVASFDTPMASADGEFAESQLLRLARLLRELDAMERRRGMADFDPWAVQALRGDIRAAVAGDPKLAKLFEDNRRAA